jgi:LPXTG-motif cell wall-anchored protein
MDRSRRPSGTIWVGAAVLTIASVLWTLVVGQVAEAQLAAPSPSDPRATFVPGNVVTCSGAGIPAAIQVGAHGTTGAADPNVSGTVAVNSGSVQPGQGQELDVTITGAGVVIDAVVVKGGNSYNVYSDPAVLPPLAGAPQHYISPFNGGGLVPDISHWFICYHVETPLPVGSLVIDKGVLVPNGRAVEPLPASYTAEVDCDDGVHVDVPITFGLGGGRSTSAILDGIAVGTVCTIVETGTGAFPDGATISYDPPGANTTGVTIGDTAGVSITIINDFSQIAVQTAPITISKVVVPTPGVDPPASFSALLVCDDGITNVLVSLPGTGGTGTPVVDVAVLSMCLVEEVPDSLPPGWTVTYSVDGAPPTSRGAPFVVREETAISVTITNDGSGATTTTTVPSSTTTEPDGAVSGAGATADPSVAGDQTALPRTGTSYAPLAIAGLGALVTGSAVLLGRRRMTGSGAG